MNWSRHPVDSRDGDGRAPGKIDQAEPRLWSRAEGGKQKGGEKNKGLRGSQGGKHPESGTKEFPELNYAPLVPRLLF